MSRPARIVFAVLCAVGLAAGSSDAQDMNDFFEDAEILTPGVLSVTAELLANEPGPDLVIQALDEFGGFLEEDDDSSQFGDGTAPGLFGIPVNPGGGIEFDVSGFEETFFNGDHTEFGDYEVFIDIYDDQFSFIEGFSFLEFIEEGQIVPFSDSNPAWDGAFYDVQLNNAFPNDVDFYRFTGLPAGAAYMAETLESGFDFIDTVLGLFDDLGNLIDSDDDGGQFGYSKLSGVVPASGEVVLAVSGFGDIDFFDGAHPYRGEYQLDLTLLDEAIPGDYSGNGLVDAADLATWVQEFGAGAGSPADGNDNDLVDGADYAFWRNRLAVASAASAQPTPEPSAILITAVVLPVVSLCRARRSRVADHAR